MRQLVAALALAPLLARLATATDEEGYEFLTAKALEPGVVTLGSGLMYRVLREGPSGPQPPMHPTATSSCLRRAAHRH